MLSTLRDRLCMDTDLPSMSAGSYISLMNCEEDILPRQVGRILTPTSYRRMCMQQLIDAIRSLQKSKNEKQETQRNLDREWIFSEGEDYLFSFESVCEALGVEARVCRERLKPLNGDGPIDERMLRDLDELEKELRYARGSLGRTQVATKSAYEEPRRRQRKRAA